MSINRPLSKSAAVEAGRPARPGARAGIPRYLVERYWWAYLHPAAIGFFDRPWVVNLILWGNYTRLRQAAFEALGAAPLDGRTLQVACVYGDLTVKLADRLAPGAALEVIDVVPRQLARLQSKLARRPNVALKRCDSAAIRGGDGGFDRALVFFLLHEQPEAVRRATLREVARVVRPGGHIVIVDYHRPRAFNPLRYLMAPILARLEPFALDLWRHELEAWLPDGAAQVVRRQRFFGGLYQLAVLAVGRPVA